MKLTKFNININERWKYNVANVLDWDLKNDAFVVEIHPNYAKCRKINIQI